MPDNRTDLRIEKTVRAIRSAFLELILTKPVHRITVTELARRAEINKGTFYLHYADIYDLYNQLVAQVSAKIAASFDPYPDLFTSPASFVRTFLFSQVEPLRGGLSPGERALLATRNIQFSADYPRCFLDAFRDQIYRVGRLTPCVENDLKLEFLLTGMLSVIVRYRPQLHGDPAREDYVVQFLAAVVRETFPEFYAGAAPVAE